MCKLILSLHLHKCHSYFVFVSHISVISVFVLEPDAIFLLFVILTFYQDNCDMLLVKFLLFASLCCLHVSADPRVLYALNAGGVSHVGSNGINYL